MLLANTATQLFYRSADGTAQHYVGGLCPLTPGRPSVAKGAAAPHVGPEGVTPCSRTGGWSADGSIPSWCQAPRNDLALTTGQSAGHLLRWHSGR